MQEYTLIALKGSYVTEVSKFIKELWDFGQFRAVQVGMEYEDFKQFVWVTLKQYWAFNREGLVGELGKHLPDNMKEPTCTIMRKQSKGEFKLEDGTPVPMFNYGGKPTQAGMIPHILSIVSRSRETVYESSGKVQKNTEEQTPLHKLFEGFKNN